MLINKYWRDVSMDKNDVILITNQCFEKEGNCLLLHFVNGIDMVIAKKPKFTNSCLHVDVETEYDAGTVNETHYIPYRNILYITETNVDNLAIILDYELSKYKLI